ncbi:[Pyruvate dehydrogenase [acetyl-transferring]]-phosphatase 1, mitochondrial [Apophysomyces sp. BC1034]|nr:[Pyruvate dehydrogenase [acetyl-transferring]]-phosphatase 1, mitochondrial [Apophysomyces sp. BC1015]KAG0178724.1 [Pyruvate dehydrogenase [acetyl-transferring]]-phosphatase 1, mitochondrial [Apophysomyces sp. BC1021]KAG0193038.1 [Pyruvate dehydrogenase [acetyl-transferring]]-phosphatase 1, mitochondrial [Apophysomyces sp. BC1034]
MPVPIRTISTAAAGLGLSGAGYYYYKKKVEHVPIVPLPEPPQFHDSRPFQLLTPTDINNRLRSGQSANSLSNKYVKAIYTSQVPSNNPVEDNYSVNTFAGTVIAGVYDGHVGPHCSRMIKTQLPIYVARELESAKPTSPSAVQDAISKAFVDLDQDIQQRFYDLFPKNLSRVTEQDIRASVNHHPNPAAADMYIKEAINGSCACLVYLDGDDLYAANAGDSRVVVIRQEEDGTWSGRRLVEEQSPAHPAWRAHMIAQHPPEEADAIVKRNRIFGLIAVGGSFGDIMYKVPQQYQMKVLPFIPYETYSTFARYHHRIVVNYHTPPYLSAKPLTSHHKLVKGDRYIVIGTDGLWDELSWDNVRSVNGDQVAAELIQTWKAKDEKNPATHMIRESLLYEAVYKNVGERVPVSDETLELSKRLTRQPSRRYRDDITVTVIELKDGEDKAVLKEVGPVTEPEEVAINTPRLATPKNSSWFSGWFGGGRIYKL